MGTRSEHRPAAIECNARVIEVRTRCHKQKTSKRPPHGSFIVASVEIAGAESDAPQTLGPVVDALDDRAFGLLILILAIPCLVPGLPGAQLIANPIFLLGLQIVEGRNEPWLPGAAMRANLKPEWLTAIADGPALKLSVPLVVEAKAAKTWAAAH